MGDHHPAKWGGDSGKRSVQARVTRPVRVAPTPRTQPTGPEASDAAKALAASAGIDLADVVATGANGITKADVDRTISEQTDEQTQEEPDSSADEPTGQPAQSSFTTNA